MKAHFAVFILVGVVGLFSCNKARIDSTPGYPYLHTASRLASEINDMQTEVAGKWVIDLEKLTKLKGQDVKELYFVNDEIKCREERIEVSADISVLALITDQKGSYEVWQVNPVRQRIVSHDEMDSKTPPFPYGKKDGNY